MFKNVVLLLLALGGGGSSWPSQMHEVSYDCLVVPIKVSQKSLGDKPKSVYIFLQTPHEVYTRKSYFIIIIIIIKSIYKAPCLRVIKPAQRRYTKVHSIPE